MKKNFVRILALILVGLMVLSLVPLVSYGDWCDHPNWSTIIVEPVCGEDGYSAARCDVCGFERGVEIIPHTEEHDFSACVESEDYLISEGSCTEPTLYFKSCSKCGYIAEFYYYQALEQMQQSLWDQYQREVAYHGGEVTDWNLKLQQATEEVQNRYIFKVGGEGHRFYEVEAQPATCTSDGWSAYQVCADCGEIEGYETVPAKGHRFGEFVVTKEPTCTETGVKERVCEVCGEKETETVPALGHKGPFTTVKAPTCTEAGSEKRICTVCGAEEVREVAPLGHKGPFTVTREATCTEDGVQERDCTVCGAHEVVAIPAAHKFGENGICTVCGAAKTGTETESTLTLSLSDTAVFESSEEDEQQPEENGEPTIEDTETFEASPYKIELSIDEGQKYNGVVLAGQTLRATCTPELPEGYTVYWIPKSGNSSDEQNVTMIPGTSYTVPESYVNGTVVCVVVAPSDEEAGRSDTLRVRKEVTINMTTRGQGEMKFSFERLGDEEGSTPRTVVPSYTFLTGDRVTFSVKPDTANRYIFRRIATVNGNTTSAQSTTYDSATNTSSHTFTVSSSNATNYLLEADRPSLYNEVKPTLGDDSDIYISKDAEKALEALRKEIAGAYKVSDDTVVSGVIRYVTPIWASDALAMNKDAIERANAYSLIEAFTLDYPSGINYEKDIIQAYHYNVTSKQWEQLSSSVYTLQNNGAQVEGFTDFSPFAVIGIKQIEITLDANNGSGETDSIKTTKGAAITAPACSFTAGQDKTFKNWNTKADGTGTPYEADKDTLPTGDNLTLYAQWTEGHTITFNSNNIMATGAMDSQFVIDGNTVKLTKNAFTLKNHDFLGWSETADGEKLYDDEQEVTPDKDLALYAKWERKASTVYFDAQGGSGAMSEQTAALGGKITLAKNSFTYGDYLFAGWADVKGGDVKYQDGQTIDTPAEDITLYAVWKYQITVSFDKNSDGAGGSMANQTVPGGMTFKLNKNTFTAPALSVFNGWNPVRDGSGNDGKNYEDGANITLSEDTTLYAQWKRTAYTVTYVGNGGTGSMSSQTIPLKGAVAISQNGFTAPYGKAFLGWSEDPDATEEDPAYNPGQKLEASTLEARNEDLTLYAVWGEIITVNFYPTNGQQTGTGTMAAQQLVRGKADSLNANKFTAPTDYKFTGWNTQPDGSGTAYADSYAFTKDEIKALPTVLSLYAQWERSAYNVTFDKNNTNATGTMAAQKISADKAAALNANTFGAPTNYAFKYWTETQADPYPDKSASEVTTSDVYRNRAQVNTAEKPMDKDITLYAQWERVSYTVSYNANGGTGTVSAQTLPKDGAIYLATNRFTAPAGKIFAGWSKTNGTNNTIDYHEGDELKWEDLTNDLPLYAVWKQKVTITFNHDSDSGSGTGSMAAQEVASGETFTLNENKFGAPNGKAFGSWNTKVDGTGDKYTDGQTIENGLTADTTLYAQWLDDACTITFYDNKGEGTEQTTSQSILKNTATPLKPNSFTAPAGMAFKGWNTQRDGSGSSFKDEANVRVTKDINLYAQWGYAITFDKNADDATGTMDVQAVTANEPTKLNANAFTRINYEFEGWTTNPDGTGDRYADQGTVTTDKTLTLYAVWKQIAYAITYDANGGGGTQMAQQNVPIGNTATIRDNAYNAKPGQVFAYWEDQNGTQYNPGDKIEPTADLALKAIWVEKLEIYYYPGEGSGSYNKGEAPKDVPTDIKTASEAKFTAPAGATFAYWQDGNGNRYYEGKQYTFSENTSLTAVWAPAITITFNKNASDAAGTMAAQTVGSGVETALNANRFSRSDYIFKYWTKTKSDPYPGQDPNNVSSSDVYKDGTNITVNQNTTLYAQWYKTAITQNAAAITGELTGLDDFAVWGETLTALVNDPVLKSGFNYNWLVDGNSVKEGTDNTYEVRKEDYGKTIICEVTHPQATNKVESNTKIVGTYAEDEDLIIINNGDPDYPYSKYAYVYGVVPGATFTKDGRDYLVPDDADGYMEIAYPGVYTFGYATYTIENWYTVGYEVDNSGSGTVTMKNGSTTLTSNVPSSMRDDIQYYANNVWLVRQGSVTDLSITMKPASSTYVHWNVNGGNYSSSATEVTRRLGNINQPILFTIVFNKSSSSPKTGDMSHLGMWSALCFTSLAGAAATIGASRKRRKSGK